MHDQSPTPDVEEPRTKLCPKCQTPVLAADRFCRQCGRKLTRGDEWMYSHVGIIAMMLTVLGPFAVGLVWRSKQLSHTAKIIYTIAILIFSAALLFGFFWILRYYLNLFTQGGLIM